MATPWDLPAPAFISRSRMVTASHCHWSSEAPDACWSPCSCAHLYKQSFSENLSNPSLGASSFSWGWGVREHTTEDNGTQNEWNDRGTLGRGPCFPPVLLRGLRTLPALLIRETSSPEISWAGSPAEPCVPLGEVKGLPTGLSCYDGHSTSEVLHKHSLKWQPTPGILPGAFHGQSSPAGYSPWGCKESGTTEQSHSLTRWALVCARQHAGLGDPGDKQSLPPWTSWWLGDG